MSASQIVVLVKRLRNSCYFEGSHPDLLRNIDVWPYRPFQKLLEKRVDAMGSWNSPTTPSRTGNSMTQAVIKVEVVCGNALTYPAGVLVLTHAQGLFGLDAIVVRTLRLAGRHFRLLDPGDDLFEPSVEGIAAQQILFVG